MQWNGANVAITGAGSGIGKELARALSQRGAKLWLSDIDEVAVKQVAYDLGGEARAARLDVSDAEAVQAHVESVVEEGGRIDAIFNNAGIGVGGDALDLNVGHYDRCIDVNVRGVVNGVVAAYPRMAAQGRGLIVNTASAAGLLPIPLMAPYALSRHAVVGFSGSLRTEAAAHGVQVSVLCPTAIETPLLDSPIDNGEGLWRPDIRKYLTRIGGPPYPVDRFVANALRAIERGKGVIVEPFGARMRIVASRLFPSLVERIGRSAFQEAMAEKR